MRWSAANTSSDLTPIPASDVAVAAVLILELAHGLDSGFVKVNNTWWQVVHIDISWQMLQFAQKK